MSPRTQDQVLICPVHKSMMREDNPMCERAQIWADTWLERDGIEWHACPSVLVLIEYKQPTPQ